MRLRNDARRGGILLVAVAFVLAVSLAGLILLSISYMHQVQMDHKARAVRLMAAAEAAIETKRGRFTLIPGVQDDWSALLPTSGWNNIDGPFMLNQCQVQVQAMPIGGPSVPAARIRAIATQGATNRVVEYNIRVANFSEFALYFGGPNVVGIGPNFKMWGNFYSEGAINLLWNPGIEFFLDVTTTEDIRNAPDMSYNFKKTPTEHSPQIVIPPAAYGMDILKAVAVTRNTLFYKNTLSIQFNESNFIRTYWYRKSGVAASGPPTDYEIRTETRDIPDEGTIYIDQDEPPAGIDSWSGGVECNQFDTPLEFELTGTIFDRRVTLACEYKIAVKSNIAYRTLLNNPDLRRFANKESAAATAYKEMLGVISATDIDFQTTVWSPLPAAQMVTNSGSDVGHLGNQYCLDGVFMGVESARRFNYQAPTNRELWTCGGIINGNNPSTQFGNIFDRRNYDWDARLFYTTPPYFLRAYNISAVQVRGTWRSYEL